ncbi:uncharacterized protein LOC131952473 isoform X2 [Physella acuta]|uniref:uncharacterized protein LOC131952473 isoform X2 n=1 Tax=Physella acuta TaxID=109671 RepID=UPI0027DDC865|nr:uncharacterized protein LOC131952473 isoform X2 [Physella acuta]
MGDIVKSGYIKRYSKSFLSGGWNNSFLQLHRDSTLNVYKKQGESKCQGSIYMKDVCKYFAYGEFTSGMPDRPDLPPGGSYDCIMGIPQKPSSKAKIHWFLFSTTKELHDWMNAICSVLPPPPQKDPSAHAQHPPQQSPQHHVSPSHAPSYTSASHPPSYTSASHPPSYTSASHPPAGYAPPPQGPMLGFENLTVGGPAPPYPPAPGGPQYRPPSPLPQAHQYPQPQYYPPPPQGAYSQPAPQGYYPQQSYHPAPNPGYPQQQYYQPAPGHPHQTYSYQQPVVYQQHHKKGGILGSNTGKMVAGLAGGALLGYGASRMMGGGWGLGRWGSWSSLSSFGSFGSCGSFGSFGSFD